MQAPSPNGFRDQHGRFTRGNAGGPGNPLGGQVAKLRSALLKAVKPADMREIVGVLVELAKAGNIQAIKELFDRTVGRPIEPDLLERIEHLERRLEEAER